MAHAPFIPPVHYERDDGVLCCVHAVPVGPDSCPDCRDLADDQPPADTGQAVRRDRYTTAIRDKVRIRLGSSVAALAAQGRPLKMTLTEAEPAADAVMAVADAEHAELRAELDDLRLKSERMRHELEVMHGGAFDGPAPPPTPPPAHEGDLTVNESPLDRMARAIGSVPIQQTDDGINVYPGPPMRGALAAAALEAIRPELDRLHARIAELDGGRPTRVLPAKFVTEAMAAIPDELPPDFV